MRFGVLVAALALCCAGCGADSPGRPEHTATSSTGETNMILTSSAFAHEETIPGRYTCDGSDISPPLDLEGFPTETVSLVLIMDDPDAPAGTWDHWVEFDIEPIEQIPESVTRLGTPGNNSWGRTGYGGPCPPSGSHRYFFTVYALDVELGLPPGSSKTDVLDAIEGHILEQATLMGRYSR